METEENVDISGIPWEEKKNTLGFRFILSLSLKIIRSIPKIGDWYLIRSALVQLGSGLALFDLLGCLRGDVNSANGLTIGIKGSTSVLTCRKRKVLLN